MYFYKIIDEFPRLICAKKTVAPIIIKRHHGMGLFSFINLKKRKRITLLVVDLDKIIKGAGKQKTRAIPYKSAREPGERFFVRKRWKTAGILCVLQGFPNEFLTEKVRQNPQTHLRGVALGCLPLRPRPDSENAGCSHWRIA